MRILKAFIMALVFLVFLSSTCRKEEGHQSILFINNSNNSVYVRTADANYPDTVIRFGDVRKPGSDLIVEAKTSNGNVLRQNRGTWEQLINSIKNDTLMIYVLDVKTLGILPWDTIVKKTLILKRYDLSLQDLETQNWSITYP